MTNEQMDRRAILTLGMADLLAEYIEDLKDHPRYSHLFKNDLKLAATNYRKKAGRLVDFICEDQPNIGELVFDVQSGIGKMLDTAEFTHEIEKA